ncbi:DnaB-like helicase C-terminal domain-containing protein [Eubacterium oxidoreducens]|uniref:DnaB-like helicase C terminal domain-containing protein n=1 Tax=Eubacterium oxidoreducens TaxID=1732 RepID=A0A1G6AZ08_EUBOX|nr:DnaB-like helicase C-terminal domain-containing protein [Eubacterium oxidoreducens]SDB13584.1 DnaB-like helicase C terminal domain-containing protein [Eubacterium oxidoreducens]
MTLSKVNETRINEILSGKYQDEQKQLDEAIITGFKTVDNLLHGLQKGKLYLLSGCSEVKRQQFTYNIVNNVITQSDKRVLYITSQICNEELIKNLILYNARVDISHNISKHDWQRMLEASKRFGNGNLWVNDAWDLSIYTIIRNCRKMMEKPDFIIVEDLQSLCFHSSMDIMEEDVKKKYIIQSLKELADEIGCAILLFTNQGIIPYIDKRKKTADYMERYVDQLLYLFEDEYSDGINKNVIYLFVAKNVPKEEQIISFGYLPQYQKFFELDFENEDPEDEDLYD